MIDPNWNAVVTEVGPALYRYFSATPLFPHAADLVQEVLIRLIRKHRSGEFNSERGTLRMYAFGIAHYVRMEALKAAPIEHDLFDQTSQSSEAEPAEGVRELREALAVLSEMERQIVLLHIDEELTLLEISELLQIPIGTVKSHVHRAKEKLRQRLSPQKGQENG